MPAGWLATRVWLDSSQCALERGVWLAVCENGKLVPISERAIADDPGHALLLDLWSMATRSRATLPDVARLNTLLDALGLLALAGLLFSLRAYVTVDRADVAGTGRVCRLDGHLAALELHRAGEPLCRAADRARGQGSRPAVAARRQPLDRRRPGVPRPRHAGARVDRHHGPADQPRRPWRADPAPAPHAAAHCAPAARRRACPGGLHDAPVGRPGARCVVRHAAGAAAGDARAVAHALSRPGLRREQVGHPLRRRLWRGDRQQGRSTRRLLLARVFPADVEALSRALGRGSIRGVAHLRSRRRGSCSPCPRSIPAHPSASCC